MELTVLHCATCSQCVHSSLRCQTYAKVVLCCASCLPWVRTSKGAMAWQKLKTPKRVLLREDTVEYANENATTSAAENRSSSRTNEVKLSSVNCS